MEDVSIRAIVIGVSLFVTMVVITAILAFYNVSVLAAQQFNNRVDIAEDYEYIMKSSDIEASITGVELRSLINKYIGDTKVNITLDKTLNIGGKQTSNIGNINNNKNWLNSVGNINESKINDINPASNYKVTKKVASGVTTLTISK